MDCRADVDATVDLVAGLPWPKFERDTEYISLHKPDEYAFIDGDIVSSDGGTLPAERYTEVTNEYLVPHSSAKLTRSNARFLHGRRAGALQQQLRPAPPTRARSRGCKLGLKPKVTNPFLNTAAQVVEIVHCTEDAIQ